MKCKAIKPNGQPCKNYAVHGHEFCSSHIRAASRRHLVEKNIPFNLSIPTFVEIRNNPDLAHLIEVAENNHVVLKNMNVHSQLRDEYDDLERRYKDLKAQLRARHSALQYSDSQLEAANASVREHQTNLQSLMDDHQALIARHETLQQENASLSRRMAEMRAEHERELERINNSALDLKAQLATYESTISRLEDQTHENTDRTDGLQRENASCHREMERERQRLEAMEAEMVALRAQYDAEIRGRDNTINEHRARLEEHKANMKRMRSQRRDSQDNHKAEIERLTAEIAELRASRKDAKEARKDLSLMQVDNQELRDRLAAMKSEYERTLAAQQESDRMYQETISKVSNANTARAADRAQFESELRAEKEHAQDIQRRLDLQMAEFNEFKSVCASAKESYEENMDVHAEQLEALRNENATLLTKYNNLARVHKTVEEERDAHREALETSRAAIAREREAGVEARKAIQQELDDTQRRLQDVLESANGRMSADTLNQVLVVMEDQLGKCENKMDILTQQVSPEVMSNFRPQLDRLVKMYCKANDRVEKVAAKVAKAAPPATKPKPEIAVEQAERTNYTEREMEIIRLNAQKHRGSVRVMVRVRASDNASNAFTAGSTGRDNVIRVKIPTKLIRSSAKSGETTEMELRRKKTNMYLYNDNEHPNQDLKERNNEFFDLGVRNVMTTYQPITLLAFGQSGSGKTTTMTAVLDNILRIFGEKITHANVSMMDIYNNKLVDLLFYQGGGSRVNQDMKAELDGIRRARRIRRIMHPLALQAREFFKDTDRVPPDEYLFTSKYMVYSEAGPKVAVGPVMFTDLKTDDVKNTIRQLKEQLGVVFPSKRPEDVHKTLLKVFYEGFVKSSEAQTRQRLYVNGNRTDGLMTAKTRPEFVTQVPVGTIENYYNLIRYAEDLRPISLTPQNLGGSSRSHLIIRFDFGAGITLNLVDLAGSEDYSHMGPADYRKQMKAFGVEMSSSDARRAVSEIHTESDNINGSLANLINYVKAVNEKATTGSTDVTYDEDEALVNTLDKLSILNHKGLTTMVATFKSDADDASLVEAYRTTGTLSKLIPDDSTLNQMRAAPAPQDDVDDELLDDEDDDEVKMEEVDEEPRRSSRQSRQSRQSSRSRRSRQTPLVDPDGADEEPSGRRTDRYNVDELVVPPHQSQRSSKNSRKSLHESIQGNFSRKPKKLIASVELEKNDPEAPRFRVLGKTGKGKGTLTKPEKIDNYSLKHFLNRKHAKFIESDLFEGKNYNLYDVDGVQFWLGF